MSQRCELCGGASHPSPDTQQDQFGLICPGPTAAQEEQDTYLAHLVSAYLNLLTTEAENYANTIGERKRLWYERTRSEVSQEELQADCDHLVQEVTKSPSLNPSALSTPESLEIDPPHLTVPGEVPQRSTWITATHRTKAQPEDALLFMDTRDDGQQTPGSC